MCVSTNLIGNEGGVYLNHWWPHPPIRSFLGHFWGVVPNFACVKFGGQSHAVAGYFTRSHNKNKATHTHWGFVLKMKSPTRAGGFVWKYSPLSECCNNNPFQHTATTVDTVIPSSSTSVDRPPSLLHFPIDDQGQPLFSPESKYSHTG